MKTLMILLMALFMSSEETTLYDFNTIETSGKWFSVNDDVMGGISKSSIIWNANGTATFYGNVSLENNGGFSSVRAGVKNMDERSYSGVSIRVKGDGNIYSMRFRTNGNFDGYAYQAKFKTKKNEWQTISIPFSDFVPTYRGYTLRNKPMLNSKDIAQIGILIADKQSGNFKLEMDWINFYQLTTFDVLP